MRGRRCAQNLWVSPAERCTEHVHSDPQAFARRASDPECSRKRLETAFIFSNYFAQSIATGTRQNTVRTSENTLNHVTSSLVRAPRIILDFVNFRFSSQWYSTASGQLVPSTPPQDCPPPWLDSPERLLGRVPPALQRPGRPTSPAPG